MKNILILCLLLLFSLQVNPSHFIQKETTLILLADEEMQCITGTGILLKCSEETACETFAYMACNTTFVSGDLKCRGYSIFPNYTAFCNIHTNEDIGCYEYSSYCYKANSCYFHVHDPVHGPSDCDCDWAEDESYGDTTVCISGC